MMRAALAVLAVIGLLAAPAQANDASGRYQAVVIPAADAKSRATVLILDTVEGHVWRYAEPASGAPAINYVSKVTPQPAPPPGSIPPLPPGFQLVPQR